MSKIYILLFAGLSLLSCHKKEDDMYVKNSDYLVIGTFYRQGENTEAQTYMLINGKVFKTANNHYTRSGRSSFEKLGDEKYREVSGLITDFPVQLLKDYKNIYGCPDCHHEGGIFLAYKKDGELRKWKIDKDTTKTPVFLHVYTGKIIKAIKFLQR